MVTRATIRTVIDSVGVAAVVGSLLFVALEIRQNTAATRSATQNAVFDGARENALALISNDRVVALVVAVEADPSIMAGLEGTADGLLLEMFHQNRLNTLENAFYHYREGALDPDIWTGWQGWLEALAARPTFTYYWERLQAYYMDDFRAVVDQAISRAN